MAQTYYTPSSRVASPISATFGNSSFALNGEKHLTAEDVQEAYMEQKDKLVGAIESTKAILGDIRKFNKDEWVVRYPRLREQEHTAEPSSSNTAPPSSPKRRKGIRRSLSFADDPNNETEVILSEQRQGLNRSVTLTSISDIQEEAEEAAEQKQHNDAEGLLPSSEFQVLRLDLKLGAAGTSNTAASLVSQLEKSSIANLLDERLKASLSHIDKLRQRVEDTSSKVLVTGDLNAGKSTFVNALLRREVMPVDQQPCTTAFCEVHDAAENNGKEEVHVVKEGTAYDINDESTFSRGSISDLEDIVNENEDGQRMIKLYLGDTRQPSESLLNNGVVDISLIDAPGLNRDSIKTTAVFARQEEIDVVVFVVSAENHFTLSAKEFLWNASNEKAYLFIVVNKFDQIKNKEKCRRLVLEQIKQLSPRTFEDAADLVHFVDSAAALQPFTANPAFDDLESSLRSFVLIKRSKSKLHPVSTYLSNLLTDVELLAGANAIVADAEAQRAKADLDEVRPVLEKMKKGRDTLETDLETTEEEGADKASSRTRTILSTALDRVGEGQLGTDKTAVPMPSWTGILDVWNYARDVRRSLVCSLDAAVRLAEDEARVLTSEGVKKINHLGDLHLPEGVERSKRVFMPEAMFSTIRRGGKGHKRRQSHSGTVVVGGMHGLGIGLSQNPDMLETSFSDLFDVYHHMWVHFGDGKERDDDDVTFSSTIPSALSVVSVGVGALTMAGGQAVGARTLIEGFLRVTNLVSNDSSRKWAAPVIGACTIGLTAYLILELPNSIPKTIGRRVRSSVLKQRKDEPAFVDAHVGRISKETRKVLRLASWDLRERFRNAMEERSKEVKGKEEMEKKALNAKGYFVGVGKRTAEVRASGGLADHE